MYSDRSLWDLSKGVKNTCYICNIFWNNALTELPQAI